MKNRKWHSTKAFSRHGRGMEMRQRYYLHTDSSPSGDDHILKAEAVRHQPSPGTTLQCLGIPSLTGESVLTSTEPSLTAGQDKGCCWQDVQVAT